MQLAVEDLPPPIRKYVEEYIPQITSYKNPDEADGKCYETSTDFVSRIQVQEERPNIFYYSFRIPSFSRHNLYSSTHRYVEIPQELQLIFHGDGPGKHWGGHTVIIYDDILIDFTARQFDATSPWPLIWKLT